MNLTEIGLYCEVVTWVELAREINPNGEIL
jgi:hypothetical protein